MEWIGFKREIERSKNYCTGYAATTASMDDALWAMSSIDVDVVVLESWNDLKDAVAV